MSAIGLDPLALVGRVIGQVVEQLGPVDEAADTSGLAPDELIATAVGNRLAQMLGGGAHENADEAGWLAHYEELRRRDSELAAALGACDCWGADSACPACRGAGTAGWVTPDEQLFATYVQPALVAPAPRTPPSRSRATTNDTRQEHHHGQRLA